MNTKSRENRFEKYYLILSTHLSPYSKVAYSAFVILIISLLMLAFLEVAAFGVISVFKSLNSTPSVIRAGEYKNQSFLKEYFIYEDEPASVMEYSPYIDYIRRPNISGKYINTNHDSLRFTFNPCSNNNSIKIFFFGGSTAWGHGVPDNFTLPSLLSRKLCEKGVSVNVTNFGESGYVNTQSEIRLLLELRKGNVPHYAIFYDGINEALAAYHAGEAGVPYGIENRKLDFGLNKRFNLITPIFYQTSIGKIVLKVSKTLFGEKKKLYSEDRLASLSEEVSNVYFENLKTIDILSKGYGFKSLYFWQPVLFTKEKKSQEELDFLLNREELKPFFQAVYNKVVTHPRRYSFKFYDLKDAFSNTSDTTYIDLYHLNKIGNEIIADLIATAVYNELKNNE
ncbi:MAG: SGNH/GDSL hydrolase family protein [Candidatus Anstonellales archaeon]